MLLLGITTAGISWSRAIGLTNAVREGSRFGATALASDPAKWRGDVIGQVQGTQFDDTTTETRVCVQLWKKGTGQVLNTGACGGAASVTGVAVPTSPSSDPVVPSNLPDGACVVRIVAGRPFTVNIGITSWTRVNYSTAVARYERAADDAVSGCS